MSHRIIIVALLAWLVSMSSCQKTLWTGGQVTQTTLNEWMPVEFTDNLLFLTVEVNGRPYRFMLDSGAPNVIDEKVAAELGLPIVTSNHFKDSQRQRQQLNVAEMATLSFGGQSVENSRTVVADLSHFSCSNMDGLLGANVLQHFDLEVDYSRPAVRFTRNTDTYELARDFPIQFPFETTRQGSPKIAARIGGKTRRFTLDTGSASAVTMGGVEPDDLEGVLRSRWIFGETSRGVFGTRTDTTHFALLDSLHFPGANSFERIYASLRPHASDIIGNRFWKNYRLLISWAHRRAYLREIKPDLADLPETQLYLTHRNDHVTVKAVGAEFLKKYPYLTPEMRVVSINGRNLNRIDEVQFCNLPHVDRYDLVVEDAAGETYAFVTEERMIVF